MGNKNSGRWPKKPKEIRAPETWESILSETPVDAVKFIDQLTHTSGREWAKQPFKLRLWQEKKIVKPLFKLNKKTGLRQYVTALLMLPRKNGKTELAAAIALYGLIADKEYGAEVYSAASEREQASLVFKAAARMVRNDPYLNDVCQITESQRRINYKPLASEYKAISAEASSKHGYNASMVLYDELHTAKNRELWDVLVTSMGTRQQALALAISTAGYDRHSILWELYSHAKNVAENPALDPTFLSVLFEAPIDADWTDEQVWKAANPALGDFRRIEEMRVAAERAKQVPAQENTFRRLYLNQWTEQADRWVSVTSWDACQQPPESLRGRRCYVGMDLSSTKDLTALVAVFPDDDGCFDVRAVFFAPRESIKQRSDRDRVPYEQWSRDGHLVATAGEVVDYEAVREQLRDWSAEYDLREIAFDPWNATDLTTRLSEQDGFTCVQMRQGFASLSAPTKALEKAILSRKLRHDGHPVLRWNISNVAVEQDATGNLKISKKVSTERIDGAAALVMALDRLERNNSLKPPSFQMLVFGGR